MITVNNVSYSYQKQKSVLKNISLNIPQGFTLLIGENGSGKTTLLKALSAIICFDGEIAIDDIHHEQPDYKELISYLPQEFSIYPKLKILDILQFVAAVKGINKKDVKSAVHKVALQVNITEYLDHRFDQCSVGTRRRIGIATTLLDSPKAVFLDEPTAGVDPKERMAFYHTMKNIFKNTHVIISTHILDDIDILADFIVMISGGRIVYSGSYSDYIHSLDGRLYEYQIVVDQKHDHIHNIVKCNEVNGMIVYRYVTDHKQKVIKGSKQVRPTSEDLWLYYQLMENDRVE